MEDDEFEALKQKVADEFTAMEANAESDARSMLNRIQHPNDDPKVSAYQLLLLNEKLKEKINFFSLMEIINIVTKDTLRARGSLKHAPSKAAKEFVSTEWRKHRIEYCDNKSEFARIYVRRIFNEYEIKITEKQMREVWLKDTPPAS